MITINSHILVPIYEDKAIFRISYLPEQIYMYNKDREDLSSYTKRNLNDKERYTRILGYSGHLIITGMLFVSMDSSAPELVCIKNAWVHSRDHSRFKNLFYLPVTNYLKDPFSMSLPFDPDNRRIKVEADLFDGCLNLFRIKGVDLKDSRAYIRHLFTVKSSNIDWNNIQIVGN